MTGLRKKHTAEFKANRLPSGLTRGWRKFRAFILASHPLCTELTGTCYAHQPIMFSPFSFSRTVTGNVVARALYDALSDGNLLVVLPLAT